MSIFSVFTKRGRARNKMYWRAKWKSARKDFKKIRKDIKKEKGLHKLRKHEEDQIREGIEFFDADETYISTKERIETFIDEHELVREMIYFADTEEYRVIKEIEYFQEKLATYQAKNPSEELNQISNELQRLMNTIHDTLNKERKIARDVLKDRQRMRDRSFLPFTLIYFKIRHLAKEGKKDAKHLKKLKQHINKVLHNINTGKTPEEVQKAIEEMHKDMKKGEAEMLEEIKDLAQIEQYLTVLEFRSDLKGVEETLEKLKQMRFPAYKEKELEEKLREAYNIVQELHRKERTETKAVYKTAA